jgi:hypothetical protein
MLLGRRKTRARWNTVGGGLHARGLTRFRASLPVALILLFVAAYLAATVVQAVELLR